MLGRPPRRSETSTTLWGPGPRRRQPITPEHHERRCVMSDGGHGASPKSGYPRSRTPIRAKWPAPNSRALPLSRNETIGDRPNRQPGRNKTIRPRRRVRSRTPQNGPLNRETLSDRPTLPPVPQPAADHPEQPIERSDHDSQTSTEANDARVDDEPLHHEAHGTSASVTTTREPVLGPHATRAVERARERHAIAESHFDLTFQVG